jgi:hypothetical protein
LSRCCCSDSDSVRLWAGGGGAVPSFLGSVRNLHGLCRIMQDWAGLCIGREDLAVGGLGQTKPIILIINDLFSRRGGLGVSGVWWLVACSVGGPGVSEGDILIVVRSDVRVTSRVRPLDC